MAMMADEEEFLSLAFDATVLVTCDRAGRFSARVLIGDALADEWQVILGKEPESSFERRMVAESIELVSCRMKDEYEIVPLGMHHPVKS